MASSTDINITNKVHKVHMKIMKFLKHCSAFTEIFQNDISCMNFHIAIYFIHKDKIIGGLSTVLIM